VVTCDPATPCTPLSPAGAFQKRTLRSFEALWACMEHLLPLFGTTSGVMCCVMSLLLTRGLDQVEVRA
jgi:hypothetical protein